MGLIARIQRWHYVYGWRLRYWWIDTPDGFYARILLVGCAGLVVLWQVIAAAIAASRPAPEEQPHQAVVWFVVWIIIAILSAVASYMLAGRPKPPVAQATNTPTTDDGQSVKHHFGTCWETDSFLLAWKLVGRDPIKTGGGKK